MLLTLGRFVMGAVIGLVLVAVFTDSAVYAMLGAVGCGAAVDMLLRPKKTKK